MKRPAFYYLILLLVLIVLNCRYTFGAELSRVGVNTERPEPHTPACPTIDALKTGESKGGKYVWNSRIQGIGGTYTLVKADGSTSKVTTSDAPFQLNAPSGAKLLRPGYASDSGTFTTDYLESKEPFGIIRLMNWMQANDVTVTKWADRAKPSDQYWSDPAKGAPIEPWLEYAKQTGKSLWLNVPFTADADYVEQLAKLCGDALKDTNVHLYVEHSNEVWNTRTKAGQQVWAAAAQAQRIPRLNIHAKRTVEIGKAFKRHLPPDRVHVQLGLQLSNYGEGEAAVLWAIGQYGKGQFDLSVAPYLGNPGTPNEATPVGYASYLLREATRWRDQPQTSSTVQGFKKWRALADKCGGKLTAYEFGIDLKTDRDIPDRGASQLLPDTGKAVEIYIDVLMREGFDVVCYYKDFSLYNQSGFWGLSNAPKRIDMPKFKAAAAAAAKYQRESPDLPPTDDPNAAKRERLVEISKLLTVLTAQQAALEAERAAIVAEIGE